MTNNVYLTSAGAFLPGEPVGKDEMAGRLGQIDDLSPRLGKMILRQNKIDTRYYALDEDGRPTHSNAEMAALAAMNALEKSECSGADVDYLATATTQGDLIVPGHASAVHGELADRDKGVGSLEIASFQSVCASSMMAARSAFLNVKAGEKKAALVTGSEFSSRWFRPGFYEAASERLEDKEARMSAEFLRWTLSDGGGALLFEDRPNERAQSFKVDWISLHSLANQFDVCMYAGATGDKRHDLKESWSHYEQGPGGAVTDGAVMLLQDMVLLKRILRGWVAEYMKLVDAGKMQPDTIDHVLCHYSAHSLRNELISLLEATGANVPEEKWWSNLYTKGNTGSAALFIMLEEFIAKGMAKPGDRILCVNPESGRAIVSFMQLTAL